MAHVWLRGVTRASAAVWIAVLVAPACGSRGNETVAPGDGSPNSAEAPLDMAGEPGESEGPETTVEESPSEQPPAPMLAPPPETPSAGIIDFGVSDEPTNEVEVVCVAQSAASELRQVYLAFALDVSASMGQGADRFNLKWLPVITASEAFFSEPESAAISASLSFFPTQNDSARCDAASYVVPDVPQTLLPSDVFTNAIEALNRTPANASWNNDTATPTLAVFTGTVASLNAIVDPSENATRAVVLVTDGVPQNCTQDANDVALVAEAVRASGMRTFVVGVENPPGLDGGGNLDNLNLIAEAGGTERAFIVQTGDPAQTEAEFKAVIDEIRGVSVSCTIEIPLPPSGTELIPEKVNVKYSGSSGELAVDLSYDPGCTSPDSWRYDDPSAPATIVLCGDTCGTVQRDVTASLNIEFGCERRGTPR